MKQIIMPGSQLRGRVRLHRIVPGGKSVPVTAWSKNQILYEWASIAGVLLTQGLTNYKIGGMYIEYENVADPNDPVDDPTFDRSGGVSYYNGLLTHPSRDYLRVPLVSALLDSSGDNFPNGNRMTFFAQTAGTEGVHGKAFSDANNSKVFGAGLVAFINEDDPTQDRVFARLYLPEASQQVKLSTSQIGIEWEVELQ